MRFVLYAVKLQKNLALLFVERVFVNANGLACDTAERPAYKIRFKGFMRLSRKVKHFPRQQNEQETQIADFAKRRHDALRNQMLYGGLR
ncbi:MAG TPA: hypothetical protein V6C76_07585 [Drouetiella sp.]